MFTDQSPNSVFYRKIKKHIKALFFIANFKINVWKIHVNFMNFISKVFMIQFCSKNLLVKPCSKII